MALRITAGIATYGRPDTLRRTLEILARQDRALDAVIVSAAAPADVPELPVGIAPRVLVGPAGLPRQRNRILDAADDADIVIFFDDDFVPHPAYVGAVEATFAQNPEIVLVTGHVVADGIGGPGLTVAEALDRLSAARPAEGLPSVFSGYGCNMAIRMAPVRARGLRFDERLPLYGWQEDVDFSRRLAPAGRIVRTDGALGVHLGVKGGRGSGRRLGYSQVANPLYLWRKRDGYPLGRALSHIGRNLAMNVVRSPQPEAWIDRRGRLAGNLMALRDLATGRLAPERVLEFR